MVLKRLTDVRTSRHNPKGAAGNGRSTSRSSSQQVCRRRLRCLTRFCRKRLYAARSAKSRLPRARSAWSTARFELTVLLFDVAVLVRDAEVVRRRLETVVHP